MAMDVSKVKFCHVCTEPIDKFKGLHYGGQTCYSCRAFFRRCHSADRKNPFEASCKSDGNCEMSAKTRRKCPKCRHVKCLQIGMRPELVLTQEEKKARFRKYYEKKALKRMTSREHMDSSGSSGSGSGFDDITPEEKFQDSSATSKTKPKTNKKGDRSRNNNNNHNSNSGSNDNLSSSGDGNGEEVLMDVLTSDSNLVQLCMDEVDKILRESTSALSNIPTITTEEPDITTRYAQPVMTITNNGFNVPSTYLTTLGQRSDSGCTSNLTSLHPVSNNGDNFGWDSSNNRFDTSNSFTPNTASHQVSEKYILERL